MASPDSDSEVARFEFLIGDAFPASDPMARYVARLSMALGDLRIAGGEYAVRPDQPDYERMYFVRLTASHLHEIAVLFDPPDATIPSVDAFVQAVAGDDPDRQTKLRTMHERVRRDLQRPLELRPDVKLASELRRIRNGFFHYHRDEKSEPALITAMELAAHLNSSYVIRERTLRANYADEISNRLVNPWNVSDEEWLKLVLDLQGRIVELIDPVSDFLHHAEAAWLHSRSPGIVRIVCQ